MTKNEYSQYNYIINWSAARLIIDYAPTPDNTMQTNARNHPINLRILGRKLGERRRTVCACALTRRFGLALIRKRVKWTLEKLP